MEFDALIITDFTIKNTLSCLHIILHVDYLLHTILYTDHLYHITQKRFKSNKTNKSTKTSKSF